MACIGLSSVEHKLTRPEEAIRQGFRCGAPGVRTPHDHAIHQLVAAGAQDTVQFRRPRSFGLRSHTLRITWESNKARDLVGRPELGKQCCGVRAAVVVTTVEGGTADLRQDQTATPYVRGGRVISGSENHFGGTIPQCLDLELVPLCGWLPVLAERLGH